MKLKNSPGVGFMMLLETYFVASSLSAFLISISIVFLSKTRGNISNSVEMLTTTRS